MFGKFRVILLLLFLCLLGVSFACGAPSFGDPPSASSDNETPPPTLLPEDAPRAYGEREPTSAPTSAPAPSPPEPKIFVFETPMVSSPANRTKNLQLVAQKLDGHIIKAGETFSFNKTVGPRTIKRGYRKAIIFVDKKKVMEVGGGVCQMASTLYNAALQAQFEIVERHEHGREIPYIALGKDATVFYGRKDLRFTNTSASDYTIHCAVEKKRVLVKLVENISPDNKA